MSDEIKIKKKAKKYAIISWCAVIFMSINNYLINPGFEQFWTSVITGIFTGGLFALVTYYIVKIFAKK